MTIFELIESERTGLQILRSIANRHPNDGEVQRLVATGALEAADRITKLNELLHYKSEDSHANNE